MSEARTMQEIRLDLGREPDVRLFRNNCGSLPDRDGRLVQYGVANPGGSDLIGWRTVTVTPEMVGQQVAIFTAIEVKTPGGRHPVTPAQKAFIAAVEKAGGLAGVARSPEQARSALGLTTTKLTMAVPVAPLRRLA